MPSSIVRCKEVTKTFGACCALAGVTLDVLEGEVLALIGPNGSGKTTLVRVLLGICRPDHGDVRVLGKSPTQHFEAIGSQIGVMLDLPGMFDHLTGTEYLHLYSTLFGIAAETMPERIAIALDCVGLRDRADALLGTLSKGMQQRMALARCLLSKPRLMILDEPFDGVDAESRRNLVAVLPTLTKTSGTSILVTSHNLLEVEKLATRVAIINHGRIVLLDSVDSLCSFQPHGGRLLVTLKDLAWDAAHEIPRSFAGACWDPCKRRISIDIPATGLTQEQILQQLLSRGCPIGSFTVERSTLEDVYFSVTSEESTR